MTGATDGDVDRALAAMGATNLKYHSFGVMTVRPPGSDPLNPGIASPGFQPNPGLPPTGEGTTERYRAHAASTVFPLLGLALPEAFQIDVEPEWPVGPPVSDPGLFLDPAGGPPHGTASAYGIPPQAGYPVPPTYPGQPYPAPAYPPPAPPPGYVAQPNPHQSYPPQAYPPQAYPPQTYQPQTYPQPSHAVGPGAYPSFSMPPWLDPVAPPAGAPPSGSHPRPAWLDTSPAEARAPEPPPTYARPNAPPLPMGYPQASPEALPSRSGADWHEPPPPSAFGEASYSPFAQSPSPVPHEPHGGSFPSWLDDRATEPQPGADWAARVPGSPPITEPHTPTHPMPEFAPPPLHPEPPVTTAPTSLPQEVPHDRLQDQWTRLPDPANFEPSRYDPYEPQSYETASNSDGAPEPVHTEHPQAAASHGEPIYPEPPHTEPSYVEPAHQGGIHPEAGYHEPRPIAPTWHEPPMLLQPEPTPPHYEFQQPTGAQAGGYPASGPAHEPMPAQPATPPSDPNLRPESGGRRPLADMFRTLGGGSSQSRSNPS